jgi:hypothetical protein
MTETLVRHIAAVHRMFTQQDTSLFRAHCRCGWWGPTRMERDDAVYDRRAHKVRVGGW